MPRKSSPITVSLTSLFLLLQLFCYGFHSLNLATVLYIYIRNSNICFNEQNKPWVDQHILPQLCCGCGSLSTCCFSGQKLLCFSHPLSWKLILHTKLSDSSLKEYLFVGVQKKWFKIDALYLYPLKIEMSHEQSLKIAYPCHILYYFFPQKSTTLHVYSTTAYQSYRFLGKVIVLHVSIMTLFYYILEFAEKLRNTVKFHVWFKGETWP